MPDFRGPWGKRVLSNYRVFMLKLARECEADDLRHMKHILKDSIPAGQMEQLDNPLDVFSELEQRDIIGPQKLEPLRDLFQYIDRPHLIKMVDELDDSYSTFLLKPKSENHLEKNGYALSIKGGRHFEMSEGEFVEVQSGSNYALSLINKNDHRCECMIRINGHDMFPSGFGLYPGQTYTLERPEREKTKFKFFAITDAPEGSGINRWRRDHNGLVEVIFAPEKADMKIFCTTIAHAAAKVLTCSFQTTANDFYRMVSKAFHVDNVNIIGSNRKLLGRRDLKLTQYGIQDGSQIVVDLRGATLPRIKASSASKNDGKWKGGTATLGHESRQKIGYIDAFPVDPKLAVTLNLRLVARSDQRALPLSEKCTPLTRATLIPPPVPE